MSDPVALALVAIIPSTVSVLVGLVVAWINRGNRKAIEDTIKNEAATTRAHVQTCCHPDDLPPRVSANARPEQRR